MLENDNQQQHLTTLATPASRTTQSHSTASHGIVVVSFLESSTLNIEWRSMIEKYIQAHMLRDKYL